MIPIVWTLIAGATGLVAQHKGYPAFGWFLLGALLPVIGLVIALCLPNRKVPAK